MGGQGFRKNRWTLGREDEAAALKQVRGQRRGGLTRCSITSDFPSVAGLSESVLSDHSRGSNAWEGGYWGKRGLRVGERARGLAGY